MGTAIRGCPEFPIKWNILMKKPRKVILIVISSLMIIVMLYLFSGAFFGVDLYRAITLKARINKIIDKTDHQALLTASRILIKEGYPAIDDLGEKND